MKGAQLTINTLVILVLAVIVLIGLIAFFMGVWTPSTSGINIESIKNSACQRFVSAGCDKSTASIKVDDYGEGPDKYLLDLCKDKYGCGIEDKDENGNGLGTYGGYESEDDCCKAVCGCAVTKASTSS